MGCGGIGNGDGGSGQEIRHNACCGELCGSAGRENNKGKWLWSGRLESAAHSTFATLGFSNIRLFLYSVRGVFMCGYLGRGRNVRLFRFSFLVISLLVILFSGCWDNTSETPVETTTQFIFISDIHFSPFYDKTIFNDLVNAEADQWAGIFEGSRITEPPARAAFGGLSPVTAALGSSICRVASSEGVLLIPGPRMAVFLGGVAAAGGPRISKAYGFRSVSSCGCGARLPRP